MSLGRSCQVIASTSKVAIYGSLLEQQVGQELESLDVRVVFVGASRCQPAAGHFFSLQFLQHISPVVNPSSVDWLPVSQQHVAPVVNLSYAVAWPLSVLVSQQHVDPSSAVVWSVCGTCGYYRYRQTCPPSTCKSEKDKTLAFLIRLVHCLCQAVLHCSSTLLEILPSLHHILSIRNDVSSL